MAVPTDTLATSSGPLLEVVQVGPLSVSTKLFAAIALFAVANGALINMIMASRLIYGMAARASCPRVFGACTPTRRTPLARDPRSRPLLAMILVTTGDLSDLADTTVAAAARRLHRRQRLACSSLRTDRVDHAHFRAPTVLPRHRRSSSAIALMTEKTGETYLRAAVLLAVGVAFWVVSRLITGAAPDGVREQLEAVARPDARPPSS